MGSWVKNEFIRLATTQVGYTETETNHNKYAQYFDTPKSKNGPYPWFNGKKQNEPWCAVWICWLFVMVLQKLLGSADKVRSWLGCPKPADNCAAGVPFLWEYLCKKGWKVDKSKGQAGDVIFLNTKKAKNGHVGMIEKTDATKYYTIEGNKSNGVRRSSYLKTSSSIYGICHPDWDSVPDPEQETEPTPAEPVAAPTPAEPAPVNPPAEMTEEPAPAKPQKSTEELAREVIAGKWGNGTERAKRLKEAGYDYNTVQNRVNEILGIKKPSSSTSGSSGKVYTVHVSDPKYYLRIRAGAGTNYPEIGKLKQGQKVTVYETKNGFGRIGTGKWAAMSHLK